MSRILLFVAILSCAFVIQATENAPAAPAAPVQPAVDTAALTSQIEKLQAASVKQVSQETQKHTTQLASSIKEDVAAQLRSTVQTLQQHYNELAGKSTSLSSQSDALAGKLDGLGANVAKVIESLQKDIASVRSQLEGFGAAQTALATKISSLLDREKETKSFATTVTEKLAEVANAAKTLEAKLEQQATSTKQHLEHLVKVSSVNSFHQATEWVRATAADCWSCTQKWFTNTVLPLLQKVWASVLNIRSVDFVGIWKHYSNIVTQYFLQHSEQLAVRVKQLGNLDENVSRWIARSVLGFAMAIAAFIAFKIIAFVLGIVFGLLAYILCCGACRSTPKGKQRGHSAQNSGAAPAVARTEEGSPQKKKGNKQ